jgi:predicted CXXCH cytochrome family protein
MAPEKDTCLSCHKNVVNPQATVVHAPVAKGECHACHDPHGAANAKLLTAQFPARPYVPYTDGEYALCFTCHKRDLLMYPDTSFATGFRNGERNLHFVHVNNKQKGRSCALCHDMHATVQPKLVADSVPFGAWRLPIKFTKTENGGSCAPGCHKPASYDRKRS